MDSTDNDVYTLIQIWASLLATKCNDQRFLKTEVNMLIQSPPPSTVFNGSNKTRYVIQAGLSLYPKLVFTLEHGKK